jgi:hypothetical protein
MTREELEKNADFMYSSLMDRKDVAKVIAEMLTKTEAESDLIKNSDVWKIYRALLYRVGGDVFTNEILCGLASFDEVELSIKRILTLGYDELICGLILGVKYIMEYFYSKKKHGFFAKAKMQVKLGRVDVLRSNFVELTKCFRENYENFSAKSKESCIEYINNIEQIFNNLICLIEEEI